MFDMADGKSERLLSICEQLNATTYVSGPSARCYLDVPIFSQRNIAVKWFDYGAYREYSQLFPPFHHNVTVLDLILNEGPNAAAYMNSFAPSSGLLNEPAAGLCAN